MVWTKQLKSVIGLACVLVAFDASARADMIVRSDGGILDGKILSHNATEVVFQADGADASAAQHLDRATLRRVLVTDEHGALISDSTAPASPAPKWNVPAEPAAPPVLAPGTAPTYVVIPLHGTVGETVLADALEKSLADAVQRRPTVVVLDIESPGGLVAEATKIIEILHRYNKKLRIVALAGQDLSAAAIFSFSVREIYFKASGTFGAATSYIPGNPNLSAKVEEKMQSAWRAVARNSAEEGRHEPLLADAMIDNDLELHLETINGKPAVKEGHGDHVLCRKGKILTLTSHEAPDCGLAAGQADDLTELGTLLKFPNWTEMKGLGTLLAASLPARADAYKAEIEKVTFRFKQDIATAINADPTETVTTATRVVRGTPPPGYVVPGRPQIPGRPYVPGRPPMTHTGTHTETVTITRHKSPARWKPDSLACVVALQQCEADIREAMALSQAFGRLGDVEGTKEALDKIGAIRATIFDNRNKHGAGQIVTTPTPPAAPGSSPGTEPVAANPGRAAPSGAGGSTEQVGGRGGSDYVNVTPNARPLIGFRYSLGSWAGRGVMRQVDPVSDHFTPLPSTAHEIVAKPGYVVGGMIVNADETNVVAFRVIFIAYANGHANAAATYQSPWQGTPTGSVMRTLAGKGEVIVGTVGRRGMNQDALGLVIAGGEARVPPSPAATAVGAAATPAAPAPAATSPRSPAPAAGPAHELVRDFDTLKIPDAPASGQVHGVKFHPDRVQLQAGWFSMRQGKQFFADQEIKVHIKLRSGEGIDGKTYRFTVERPGMNTPHVHLSWMADGEKLPKSFSCPSYSLFLHFGNVVDGVVTGKIHLVAPDGMDSFVAGTFTCELK